MLYERRKYIRSFVLALCLGVGDGVWAGIEVGLTKAEVMEQLGNPIGGGQRRGVEILIYDGGTVDLRAGRVIRFDPGLVKKTLAAREAKRFANEQKAKGLVEHKGVWITPKKKRELQRRAKLNSNPVEVIDDNGAAINLQAILIPGKITLIDFYADWCGPCKVIGPKLEALALRDGDVYLRKVDIEHFDSAISKQFGLNSIPNIRVYGRDGNLVGDPTYSLSQVKKTIAAAK